jgi:hypothetical protein
MEAATHAMAPKTSNMCDTHTVYEAAPAEMSVTKATIHTYGATHAMTETVTSKMGDIYAAVSETVTSKGRCSHQRRCPCAITAWVFAA